MSAPLVAFTLLLASLALMTAGVYLLLGLGAASFFLGAAFLCVAVIVARGAALG